MTNIFVAKLDYGVTQEDLKSEFGKFGKVNKVSIAMDKETGKSKGFAFIEMFDEDEANQAIEALDGLTLSGRQIAVKKADDRSSSPRGDSRGTDSRPKRDFSSERKPFEKRPEPSFPRPDLDDKPVFVIPETDKFKSAPKKVALKKNEGGKSTSDGKPKQQKMEAYKKSGKNNRYFDIDDDDDY